MSGTTDPSNAERALDAAAARILPPGIRFACRAIRPGDRTLLLPDEAACISSRKESVRDASGAARHMARELLAEFGFSGVPVLRAASGAPVWPTGVVGSLAHDDDLAVAVVAAATSFTGIGIDIEPAEPLSAEVADIVRIDRDVLDGVDETLATRLLFSAKEAVYKAVFPRDQVILGFEDVSVDFSTGESRTNTGRNVQLAWCLNPRIVVVAFDRA